MSTTESSVRCSAVWLSSLSSSPSSQSRSTVWTRVPPYFYKPKFLFSSPPGWHVTGVRLNVQFKNIFRQQIIFLLQVLGKQRDARFYDLNFRQQKIWQCDARVSPQHRIPKPFSLLNCNGYHLGDGPASPPLDGFLISMTKNEIAASPDQPAGAKKHFRS